MEDDLSMDASQSRDIGSIIRYNASTQPAPRMQVFS